MIVIERFTNKYSNIFKLNSQLLEERKFYPPSVIKYANANKNLVLLAIEKKSAIGFIIGFSYENKSTILTIFVNEEWRKQKIGSLLVDSLIKQKKILWYVRLRSLDYSLIGFFEKCGFRKIWELNLYQKDGISFPIKESSHINNGDFIISLANPTHIQKLMEIEKKSFDTFWLKTENEWEAILEDENAIVFILELSIDNERKKIVGFSHNSVNKSNGIREGQYIRIAVDPEYRRIGIATKLTEKAFSYFERNDVKKVYLSTVKENEQLNSMYKRWGFKYFDSDTILGREVF